MALPLVSRLGVIALAAAPLAAGDAVAPRLLPLELVPAAEESATRFLQLDADGGASFRFSGKTVAIVSEGRGQRIRIRCDGQRDQLAGLHGVFRLPVALGGRTGSAGFKVGMLDRRYCFLVGASRLEAGDAALGIALLDSDGDGTFDSVRDQVRIRSAGAWGEPQPRSPVIAGGGRLWRLTVPADLAAVGLTPWPGEPARVTLEPGPPPAGQAALAGVTLRLAASDGTMTVDLGAGTAGVAVPGTYRIARASLASGRVELTGEGGEVKLAAGANPIAIAFPGRFDVHGGVFADGTLIQLDDPALVDALGIRYRASCSGSTMLAFLRLGGEERPVGKLEYG